MHSPSHGSLIFSLKPRLSELEVLRQHLETFGEENRLAMSLVFEINLVLDELFTNVVTYGCTGRNDIPVDIELNIEDGHLTLLMRDGGVPFDPLKQDEPDIDLPLEERPIGGLGIHFVKKVMDEIIYENIDGKNVLTMKKRIVENGSQCRKGA